MIWERERDLEYFENSFGCWLLNGGEISLDDPERMMIGEEVFDEAEAKGTNPVSHCAKQQDGEDDACGKRQKFDIMSHCA